MSFCHIFQPRGFGPTKMMKDEYIETFTRNLRDSDHLVLLPVFYAGGTVRGDISSHDLADGIRAGGRSVEVMDRREAINRAGSWNACVVFGARDDSLSDVARAIAGLPHRP